MITPRLLVHPGNSLTFLYCGSADITHPFRESLEVRVSNTGIAPDCFNTRLWAHGFEAATWDSAEVSLADFAEDTIFVAFRVCGIHSRATRIDDVRGPDIWQPQTDVGVKQIPAPRFISPGDTLVPIVLVKNYGRSTASFNVTCSIVDSATGIQVYHQTIAQNLPEGGSDSAVFPSFASLVSATYYLTARANLSDDEDSLNDSLSVKISASWTKEYSYDDGVPATTSSWNTDRQGFGVKFKPKNYPARLASINFGMHSDCYPSPGGNEYVLMVLSDSGDIGTPGDTVFESGSLVGIRGAWNRVNLSSRDIVLYSGSAYVFVLQVEPRSNSWAIDLDITDDTLDGTQWITTPAGYELKSPEPPYSIPTGDFLIRATFCEAEGDVGVTRIIAPTDSVAETTQVTPRVWVKNYRSRQVGGFPVVLKIGDVYSDTVQVGTINPDSSIVVSFDRWMPIQGTYPVSCSTAHPWDLDPSNDQIADTIVVFRRDVGVDRIYAPTGSVALGDSLWPDISVHNFGSSEESPTLFVEIARNSVVVYSDSVPDVRVPANSSARCLFPRPWIADPVADYQVTAYSRLPGDMSHANDTAHGACHVAYHDIGVTGIIAPLDTVQRDSIVPRAQAHNFGTDPETFFTWLRIAKGDSAVYADSVQSSVAPGETISVAFRTWQADTGEFEVVSYTNLAWDRNRNNDSALGTCFVILHDVGVSAILEPLGTVNDDSVVTPRARVMNSGNSAESFRLDFRVVRESVTVYQDSTQLTLGPGDSSDAVFASWQAPGVGAYQTVAFTTLIGDRNPDNDTLRDSFSVRHLLMHDVGAARILEPLGNVGVGATVQPSAMVRNFGRAAEDFAVAFGILDGANQVYADTALVHLAQGESVAADGFSPWRADSAGRYTTFCRTLLTGDEDSLNDIATDSFSVVIHMFHDVGIQAILSPTGEIDSGTAVVPAVRIGNFGTYAERCSVRFAILDSTLRAIWSEVHIETLSTGQVSEVRFPEWHAFGLGNYFARCSVRVALDSIRTNDSLSCGFVVRRRSAWHRMADMVSGPRRKRVRAGSALVAVGDTMLFALKGNRTHEFLAYNIVQDNWTPACSLPSARGAGRGAAMTYEPAQDLVYAVPGGNSEEFWEYSPSSGDWRARQDIPACAVRHGAGLTAMDSGVVFLLKGGNTREFYRYNAGQDRWSSCASAPVGLSGRSYKSGSCMVAVRDYIYVLKGFENEFFAYSTTEDTWYNRAPLPMLGSGNRKKRAREGTAMTHDHDIIYLLKGGKCGELWWYDTFGDTWEQKEPMPVGSGRRPAGPGAALAWGNDRVWALKGNNTNELWSYQPTHFRVSSPAETGGAGAQTGARTGVRGSVLFAARPGPGLGQITVTSSGLGESNIRLRLLDVTGRVRRILYSGPVGPGAYQAVFDLGRVRGVGFVELRCRGAAQACKIFVP